MVNSGLNGTVSKPAALGILGNGAEAAAIHSNTADAPRAPTGSLLTQALAVVPESSGRAASAASGQNDAGSDSMRAPASQGSRSPDSDPTAAPASASSGRSNSIPIPIPRAESPAPRGRDVFEQLRDDFRTERRQSQKSLRSPLG